MENKRFYMKRELFLFIVSVLLLINEIYIIIKIVQDGFMRSNLIDLTAWTLILAVFIYGLFTIFKRKVYVEFQEDKIFYKGLFHTEKVATYTHKYEYKKDMHNMIKKITFYGEKEVIDFVIKRFSFPDMKEIIEEVERRMKK